MSRSKRYSGDEKEREKAKREEKILRQLKEGGRVPTPPPGFFHDTGEKQRGRKDRKHERTRLRDMTKDFNHG